MNLSEIPIDAPSLRRKCLRIVSMRDNEFIIDQTTFDEIIDVNDDFDEKVGANNYNYASMTSD